MDSSGLPSDQNHSDSPPLPPPLPSLTTPPLTSETSTGPPLRNKAAGHPTDNQPPVLTRKRFDDVPRPEHTSFNDGREEEFDDFPLFRRQRSESEMDMTPMVDVVFLLLIFFMITAAFGLQKSIKMPDPENDKSSRQAKQLEEKEENNILVHITEENRVFVEGEEASTRQELYAKLREQMHRGTGQQAVHLLVLAESKATHEMVVRVLDAASGVGMDSVRLKTE